MFCVRLRVRNGRLTRRNPLNGRFLVHFRRHKVLVIVPIVLSYYAKCTTSNV